MSTEATAKSSLLRGSGLDASIPNQEQQYSTFDQLPPGMSEQQVTCGQSDEHAEQSRQTYTSAILRPLWQMMSSTRERLQRDQSRPEGLHSAMGQDISATSISARDRANIGITFHEPKEKQKVGALPRPVGGNAKLGTFTGVFVPTSLNVLSILMFLRFGFILGQAGVLGMMTMLILCYLINLVTTLSISAIATNGTVRGGGAYYLISRSLGPEFGGSIGIVFYLGFAFNTGLNAVGLIDCFVQNFGVETGNWSNWLFEDYWWRYLWSSCVLLLCTAICLAGSGIFARCSNGLLVLLLVATFSIPFSALFAKPFSNVAENIVYTGPSLTTFKDNFLPHFTRGASGSQLKGRETYQDLFGILFPATGGIFAGASMSGDLKSPSRSIPKGTLYGLLMTFCVYAIVILSLAGTITRPTLYRNVNVIQDVNLSGILILMGEFATSFFSVLMGVIGSAKLLQALARDRLIPGLSVFGQGTSANDEPTFAILITLVVAQLTMLADINQIASFVTMTYLMTFLVMNLACFLLKIGSAPNFRPSFLYFNQWTAALGTIVSGASMFFVDGVYASACVGILVAIFLIIHYTTPPKSWGDEHVKFWRPQILLFVNDPRRSYKLIQFCNSLKKGALFILGHVIVTNDFASAVPEARKQQNTWTKYIDFSHVKAFVNVAISPAVEWGVRNIVLGAGLGGMRPNIIVMGFYNLEESREVGIDPSPQRIAGERLASAARRQSRRRSQEERMTGDLPTDENRSEKAVGARAYVTSVEDLLLKLQVNLAIAKGFSRLELPSTPDRRYHGILSALGMKATASSEKEFIDLWPVQMSAAIATEGNSAQNVQTTNFDTYTLILQLGCILHTVPAWQAAYTVRVIVFVEYESDVEEERGRVEALLANLRIDAKVMVFWLASGELKTYEIMVNGRGDDYPAELDVIEEALGEDEWWQELSAMRRNGNEDFDGLSVRKSNMSDVMSMSSGIGPRQAQRLERILRKGGRRSSIGNLSRLGVSLSMQTHRLDPQLVAAFPHTTSVDTSEDSDTSDDDNTDEHYDEEVESRLGRRHSVESDNEYVDALSSSPAQGWARAAEEAWVQEQAGVASSVASSQRETSTAPESPVQEAAHTYDEHPVDEGQLSPLSLPSTRPGSGHERADPSSSHGAHERAALSTSPESPALDTATPLPTHLRRPAARRPQASRHKSFPTLSSAVMPRATVATEEGPGPSIMFSMPSPPARATVNPLHSIYDRYARTNAVMRPRDRSTSTSGQSQSLSQSQSQSQSNASSVAPAAASAQPLSFNALPSRAQYLVLNELMRRHSGAAPTAVIFTTLPAPEAGTCESDEESLRYLGDLETLCGGLPPVLMVHSKSMSVTMSL